MTASIAEANKVLRVLTGERLKFTVRVHHADGKVTEFQSNERCTVKWHDEARALWLFGGAGDYSSYPVMAWQEGSILLVEENPKGS